ncbi:hypothetical protein Tco_1288056, partial [Tanacetum coccineum]
GIVDIVVIEGLLMKKDIDETRHVMIGHELNVRHCHSDIPRVVDQLVKANIVLIDVFTWKHLEPLKLIVDSLSSFVSSKPARSILTLSQISFASML